MSEPVHSINQQIVTNGDMSANVNSSPTNIDEVVSYSIQAVFTGTPVGILQLQGSNDNVNIGGTGPTNWTVITDSISGITAAGTYLVNVELPTYSWVRLQYVRTSSVGTINARINAKRR